MITNQREYLMTRNQIGKLEVALARADRDPAPPGVDPVLAVAARDALAEEISELRRQLRDYERLREGRKTRWLIDSLGQLPEVIMQARIASRMTQKEFAAALGVREQQVQRYEATQYRGVMLSRIEQCLQALGLEIEITVMRTGEFATSPTFVPLVSDAPAPGVEVGQHFFQPAGEPAAVIRSWANVLDDTLRSPVPAIDYQSQNLASTDPAEMMRGQSQADHQLLVMV